jgi:hypothetical protein
VKFRALVALCPTLVATAQALGAQAIDCQIEKSDYFINVGSSLRMSPDANLLMTVRGKLRNNEQVTYEKDEPVVVADVQIFRTTPVLIPSADMTLKQDGFIALRLKMLGKRPLPALQEIALPDGRVFLIAPVSQDHAVVATKAGELCNVAISYRVPDPYWVHGMQVDPVDTTIESKIQEDVADRAGVRIIFNGVAAGQLNFQEVWVSGSSIRSSVARSFDQFAKTVHVGLFDFEVVDVSNGKVTLRYEIQDRGPVKAADVTKAGLRPGAFAGAMVVRTRRR